MREGRFSYRKEISLLAMSRKNHSNQWKMLTILFGSKTNYSQSVIIIILLIILFIVGVIVGSNYSRRTKSELAALRSPIIREETLSSNTTLTSTTTYLTPNIPTTNTSYPHLRFEGYNLTHLWSFRVADENYLCIARSVPCRTIKYRRRSKTNLLNTCDYSSKNEFALENSIRAQKWLFEHQHPQNCSNKRFAIIHNYASSGYGSTIHLLAWAFSRALVEDRIAVYKSPGNWHYSACPLRNLDCAFLPITNCTVPTTNSTNQIKYIAARSSVERIEARPRVFHKRSFNWYRAQLIFYLMRFNPETLNFAQNIIHQSLVPPSVDLHRPYISLYVRRSDKVRQKEMSQAYSVQRYFDLFDLDAGRANISTIFINSEDQTVFDEFHQLNKEKQHHWKLISINVTRNVVLAVTRNLTSEQVAFIASEFLAGLYIEVNGDLHSGTLTSNWCRLVDEFRLVLGKLIPYYTPEPEYLMDW